MYLTSVTAAEYRIGRLGRNYMIRGGGNCCDTSSRHTEQHHQSQHESPTPPTYNNQSPPTYKNQGSIDGSLHFISFEHLHQQAVSIDGSLHFIISSHLSDLLDGGGEKKKSGGITIWPHHRPDPTTQPHHPPQPTHITHVVLVSFESLYPYSCKERESRASYTAVDHHEDAIAPKLGR